MICASVYLLVFIQNLRVHLAENILLLPASTFGGISGRTGDGGMMVLTRIAQTCAPFFVSEPHVPDSFSIAGQVCPRVMAVKVVDEQRGDWTGVCHAAVDCPLRCPLAPEVRAT